MIQFLIILFIIIFLQLIISGIIFSKITVEVNKCDFSYNEVELNKIKFNEFEISVKLYLFKFLKILSIKIVRDYLSIFGIKIKFDFLKRIKKLEENYKKIYLDFKEILKNRKEINLKLISPKLTLFKLNFDFGISSQMLTTFFVPILSTIISFILRNSINKYNINNFYYKITPKYYNRIYLKLNFQTKLNFDTINLLIFIINIKKYSIKINDITRIPKQYKEKNKVKV